MALGRLVEQVRAHFRTPILGRRGAQADIPTRSNEVTLSAEQIGARLTELQVPSYYFTLGADKQLQRHDVDFSHLSPRTDLGRLQSLITRYSQYDATYDQLSYYASGSYDDFTRDITATDLEILSALTDHFGRGEGRSYSIVGKEYRYAKVSLTDAQNKAQDGDIIVPARHRYTRDEVRALPEVVALEAQLEQQRLSDVAAFEVKEIDELTLMQRAAQRGSRMRELDRSPRFVYSGTTGSEFYIFRPAASN